MMHGFAKRMGGGLAAALCALALVLVGCEEDVTSVLGTERVFTLYGVFTPEQDTQWVRVFPIEPRLEPTPPRQLDARVTSEDLATGEVRIWSDSLIQEADGEYAHVFWSKFRAQYGHTYRLTATRADGAASRAEAVVPVRAEIVQQPARTGVAPIVLPLLVQGEVPRLMRIDVTYGFRYSEAPGADSEVVISYDGKERKTEGGWIIPLNLSADFTTIRQALLANNTWSPTYGAALLYMSVRLTAVSADWVPPGGVFDPEVLVQPGTMSNVENGFGFVGGGYRLRQGLTPNDEAAQAAGFRSSRAATP